MKKYQNNAEEVKIKLNWSIGYLQFVLTGAAGTLIYWFKIPADNILFLIGLLSLTLFTIIYVIFLICTK